MNSNLNKNCCIIDLLPSKCHTTTTNNNNNKIEPFTCKICLNKYIDDYSPSNNASTSTNTLTFSSTSDGSSSSTTTSASSSSFDINSILNSDENDDLLLNAMMSEHNYDTLSSFKSPVSSSSIYQIQSCKCKFCVNVS